MKVLIIGGVAGGASAAARLRRLDESAEITIVERSGYVSYANCGLPYYIGGAITEKADLVLKTPADFYDRFRVNVLTSHEAVAVDPVKKLVQVKNLKEGAEVFESYDKLLLCPGAKPLRPPIKGLDNSRVFVLRNVEDTFKLKEYIDQHAPKKAFVIGGGYIGMEMAENLMDAGIDTVVAEMADHIIGPLDYDMACEVQNYVRRKGLTLYLKNGVTQVDEVNGVLQCSLATGEAVSSDFIVLAAGVSPDTEFLKGSGITLNERGAIVVNSFMETSAADIYAAGDAVQIKNFVTGEDGYIPLAGPANKQGRIAADNICGIPSEYKGTQGSSVMKVFGVTVAATGLNEANAQRAGLQYDKMVTYSPSHATYYPGAGFMSIKVLFEKSGGRLLGAQIVGFEGVDKRCDVIAAAIRGGLDAQFLTELELCYAPPYSSAKDPVNMAGYAIGNVLSGSIKQYHWHDAALLIGNQDVFMLDTRTEGEYAAGHMEGAVNIPLDELRERLAEIPREKTIYVNCQSGLRSYIACRILMQNGFQCRNLSGGYRFYKAVMDNGPGYRQYLQPPGLKIAGGEKRTEPGSV